MSAPVTTRVVFYLPGTNLNGNGTASLQLTAAEIDELRERFEYGEVFHHGTLQFNLRLCPLIDGIPDLP